MGVRGGNANLPQVHSVEPRKGCHCGDWWIRPRRPSTWNCRGCFSSKKYSRASTREKTGLEQEAQHLCALHLQLGGGAHLWEPGLLCSVLDPRPRPGLASFPQVPEPQRLAPSLPPPGLNPELRVLPAPRTISLRGSHIWKQCHCLCRAISVPIGPYELWPM